MNEVNVLQKLVDGTKRATTAVVLTHNIDFVFAQSVLSNRLRRSGAPRLTIFADAGCAAGSFGRQADFVHGLGRSFRVVPVDLGAGRRFHPKAIFLAGPEGASLAVGSGNLGHGGWSGNQEIWTYYDTPGEGGPEIAAFRDYLIEVCDLAGASDAVRETVMRPFKAEPWAATLPEPSGLMPLPADAPLLDRMLDRLPAAPSSLDVIVPYFDAEGSALTELSERLAEPIRVMVQRGKEGLSSTAAAGLPSLVKVVGVAPLADERRTIHAKLYAAHYPDHVVLMAGSANCSRAALMSTRSGNAELMSHSRVAPEEYEALIATLAIHDQPPALPATAPNDDWDAIEAPAVRIVSASFENGTLAIRCIFSAGTPGNDLNVLLHDGAHPAAADGDGTFRLRSDDPGSRVQVEVQTTEGTARSAPMWIDHEAALRVGRRELDVQARLGAAQGLIGSDGLIDIFSLVVEHLESPVPWSGTTGRSKEPGNLQYDLADVFSDGFGRRSYVSMPGGGYLATDEWALMNDYFRLGGARSERDSQGDQQGDASGDEMEEPAPSNDGQSATVDPIESSQLQKLNRLIERAVASMASRTFLESRPPARLAADLRTMALLLGIARRRVGMDRRKVDATSAKLFYALFVGDGARPLIDAYVEAHPEAPAAMRSPELTAAMTLWVADLADRIEAGEWFEFAATRVAAAHPWLADGGEETIPCLERLSVHVSSLAEALPEVWVGWVRGGAAVKALENSLTETLGQAEFSTRQRISPGEIVWIADQLAVTEAGYVRRSKAEFLLLKDNRRAKFEGNRAVPILDVADGLDLPSAVVGTIKRIVVPLQTSEVRR